MSLYQSGCYRKAVILPCHWVRIGFSSESFIVIATWRCIAAVPLRNISFRGRGCSSAIPSLVAMKGCVLKPRPAARGSVSEEGVRKPLPVEKLVLKPRPLAHGSIGLVGLRRAVRGGEPDYSSAVDGQSVVPSVFSASLPHTVTCKSLKAKAKVLQKGEIAVSLSEDESDEDLKDVSGGYRLELGAR